MKLDRDSFLACLTSLPSPAAYHVAYSGGRDSHVLLELMALLAPRLPAPVAAVHVHHGLQQGAARWAGHCERVCADLGVPYRCIELALSVPPGESLEAVAREARYRALAGILGDGEMVLTAHHRSDQAETVLLQLLRGAGVAGLAAMPVLAPLGPGLLGRPLLSFDAEQVAERARRRRLQWLEDPSNRDTGFDRNFLRQRVIPLLAGRWPALSRTLARSARHCAEAQALIDESARADLEGLLEGGGDTLSTSALAELSPPRARAALRAWIRGAGFRVPDSARLDRILTEMVGAAPDRSPMVHWAGAELRRYRGRLYLMPPLQSPAAGTVLRWDGRSPLVLPAGLGSLSVRRGRPGIDSARWARGTIEIRFGRPSGRLRLAGEGCSRSFRQFCQQRAIPPWERDRLPLIHLDGELAAVAGLCLCEPFASEAEDSVQPVWGRTPPS
ncbi:MAG TPA: tRNA lysidine(34) synthetase TilS [Sedimenticola thiotaurini]|uniref:tRNA(Ile)-lysidine synthase n=1 Tax=Sedimenticola thiotaurini TaxID=1543721 RepID=A0A831W5W5_9GAMM|nr:tRNA lysidine(34) synthetase TilS [Sedimenticola thiotaurini]